MNTPRKSYEGFNLPVATNLFSLGSSTKFPLSNSQIRGFVHDKSFKRDESTKFASIAYNVQICFQVNGSFDQDAMQSAIHFIYATHTVFRCCISESSEGLPENQIVFDPIDLPLSIKFKETSMVGLHQELRRQVSEPFSMSRDPKFRAEIFRIECAGNISHAVSFLIHHFFFDGYDVY
jgi:hypothetical protein